MNIFRNHSNEYTPKPSSSVYALRREGNLDAARSLAESIIQRDGDSDDIIKAYAWTLIDIAKREKLNGNIEEAFRIVNLLEQLDIDNYDEFTETLLRTIRSLKYSLNPHYDLIQQAKKFSKDGDNNRAIEIFSTLYKNGELSNEFHEDYGWVIYRYLKEHIIDLDSVMVRTKLRDYIVLNNDRPSLLHSQILNFTLNYSKQDDNFKFSAFLRMWNPANLRDEDFKDSIDSNGGKIRSLMCRVARNIVDYPKEDIKQIVDLVPLYREKFQQLLQEQFFWIIYNKAKKGNAKTLWDAFDKYLDYCSDYPASEWHSKILGLAERTMNEKEPWRFVNFFRCWNFQKFRKEDWVEENGENGEIYKPLAIKVINKVKDCLLNDSDAAEDDIKCLIELYSTAIEKYPDDDWSIRSKALLYLKINQKEEARKLYKDLLLSLGNKYYIWQEYANCYDDKTTKAALLCKAISLEKNEDFLGKIRLELAKCLICIGEKGPAAFELNRYKSHYEEKSWKTDPQTNILLNECSGVEINNNNNTLYEEYRTKAESIAYEDIPKTNLVLIDRWKNDKNKDMLFFSDGHNINVTLDLNRFPKMAIIGIGQVCEFKLYRKEEIKEISAEHTWQPSRKEVIVRFVTLTVNSSDLQDWSTLPTDCGYVDYVNTQKKVYHIYSSDSTLIPSRFETQEFNAGDFVKYRRFTKTIKEEVKTFAANIVKCDPSEAIPLFKSRIVAVDDVNITKQLFHYVAGTNLLDGIIRFEQTKLRPNIGDCIKIYYYLRQKNDKNNPAHKIKIREVVRVEQTREINTTLVKETEGYLSLKYNEFDIDNPSFAFIGDYYVHRSILEKYNIQRDCFVKAKVIYTGGGKWKVYSIIKPENEKETN